MATPEQIERALRNAHAAGDTQAARRLAQAYREASSAAPPQQSAPRLVEQRAQNAVAPEPAWMSERQRMRQTIAASNPENRQPFTPRPPSMSPGEIGAAYKDVAIGALQGAPSATLGIPGDLESLGRMGLSAVGLPVSTDSLIPTSTELANSWFGEPVSEYQSGGRILGGFLGPSWASAGLKGAGKAAGWTGQTVLGQTTGVGGRAVQEAFRAGREGGAPSAAFLGQMRGLSPADDVVQQARGAVSTMRQQRSDAYKAGIGSTIQGDPTVLDFRPIYDAIQRSSGIGQYQGKVTIGGADKVWNKIDEVVSDWRGSDPNIFHTPEGLDALKQRIGNLAFDEELRSVAGPGTPGERIVMSVYNAIKDQIGRQAPGYATVMKDYSVASEALMEVERGLSLGRQATVDTALRKLQSILRNNVNTNYGSRVSMGENLDSLSGGTLIPSIAGQSLNQWTPRGIQGALAGGLAGGGVVAGVFNPSIVPALATGLAISSPRLVGETAHALGRVSNVPQGASVIPHVARIMQQQEEARRERERASQPSRAPSLFYGQ